MAEKSLRRGTKLQRDYEGCAEITYLFCRLHFPAWTVHWAQTFLVLFFAVVAIFSIAFLLASSILLLYRFDMDKDDEIVTVRRKLSRRLHICNSVIL